MKYCDSTGLDRSIAKKCFMIAHCFIFSVISKFPGFFIDVRKKIRTCFFFLVRKKMKRTQVLLLLKYCSSREMRRPEEKRSCSDGRRNGEPGAPVPWPLIACHILQCHCHLPNNHSNAQQQHPGLEPIVEILFNSKIVFSSSGPPTWH